MRSVADREKLEACANFLINARGYLVVSVIYGSHWVGQIVNVLWNVQVEQPLRVIGETTQDDWLEQRRIASEHFDAHFKKNFYFHKEVSDEEQGQAFYRVITD